MRHFFVHIPKTAGTSFRRAAEDYFGMDAIAFDYGRHSEHTHPLVNEHLYLQSSPDRWSFYRALNDRSVSLLGGHVGVNRFVDGVGVNNTLTFFREPLQRTASEYAHSCRHHDYKGSFRDFFDRAVMRNRLSKTLGGIAIEALGFVGLTERYAESLALINDLYGWELARREENMAGDKPAHVHTVAADDERDFYLQNEEDVALFALTQWLLETRLALHARGLPYVHGKIQQLTATRVNGWAWWSSDRDEPVSVEVWVNDELLTTVPALDLRPGLVWLGLPRGGHVGFSAAIDAQVGDRVNCRVAETGQWFQPEPMVVTDSGPR